MKQCMLFGLGLLIGAFVAVRRMTRRFGLITPPALAPLLTHPLRLAYRSPQRLTHFAELASAQCVLEIGCGNGAWLPAVRTAASQAQIVALDVQAAMLSQARRLSRGVSLCQATATHLPFADSAFDRVLMIAVLPMIRARRLALREVRRLLRQDGLLIVGEDWLSPEYVPWRVTCAWLENSGFQLVAKESGLLHYTLKFTPTAISRHSS